jgi:hypothetical protein
MGTRTSAVMFAVTITAASAPMADDAAVQKLLDRAEIETLVTSYVKGLDTLDADLYAGVFAEDAVFELPGGVVHRGRAAIRKIVTDLQDSRARNQARHCVAEPVPRHVEHVDRDHRRPLRAASVVRTDRPRG